MSYYIKDKLYVYKTTELGSELVTNGTFASNLSGWTNGGNWAQGSGKAIHTAGSTATLSQDVGAVVDEIYNVSITVSNRTAGRVGIGLGGDSGFLLGANGTFTRQIIAVTTGNLIITPSVDFDGRIDDVSVKLVTGGDIVASGDVTASVLRPRDFVVLAPYDVADLPTEGVDTGSIALARDLDTPTYGAEAVGGGSDVGLVLWDGTIWKT